MATVSQCPRNAAKKAAATREAKKKVEAQAALAEPVGAKWQLQAEQRRLTAGHLPASRRKRHR
jgi:hypothetical protein